MNIFLIRIILVNNLFCHKTCATDEIQKLLKLDSGNRVMVKGDAINLSGSRTNTLNTDQFGVNIGGEVFYILLKPCFQSF